MVDDGRHLRCRSSGGIQRSQVAVGGSFVVNDPNVILQAAIDGVGIANLLRCGP
jgi:DNA-binding transcriptional LysR family regulator